MVLGALTYDVQRSSDGGVTYSSIATPAAPSYLDVAVTTGTLYYYKVAAVNASGTGAYTAIQTVIPTTSGEMSLGQVRLAAQQRADRVNSQFVTLPEWNSYINQSYFELYDLLCTVYEDYFLAPAILFQTDGTTFQYPLPNGVNTFQNAAGQTVTPDPFYKLRGVDLALQTSRNAFVTIDKFNFGDRNRFVYPNTASTIYGVFNLRYRLMGNQIEFIPTPSAGQLIRLWYIPRLTELLQDTDILDGISGWTEYVITDAAIKALQKEESDVSVLAAQKMMLIKRIEESAMNRDVGQPDTITDVRRNGGWGNTGGWNGPSAGF